MIKTHNIIGFLIMILTIGVAQDARGYIVQCPSVSTLTMVTPSEPMSDITGTTDANGRQITFKGLVHTFTTPLNEFVLDYAGVGSAEAKDALGCEYFHKQAGIGFAIHYVPRASLKMQCKSVNNNTQFDCTETTLR